MKYLGRWRIHSCMSFDEENGVVYKALDEMLEQDPADDTAAQMKNTVIEFTEDGSILTLMRIPEGTPQEALDQARASGMVILDDGFAVLESKQWKEEDGQVKFDSGIQGEIMGEKADPWVPVSEDGDGLLVYLTMKLERI